MPLTPYPSLATLPEVISNGGSLPAHMIDVFAARTVYASSIPGVKLDCDLATGLKVGGGTPTDNAARLNAVLATATAANPVHLVIDGCSALGAALLIPATGHVTISGHGWGTGFSLLSGSNCQAIQNIPPTDLAIYRAWNPGGPQSIAGSNVVLSNFHVNGNRGTYPNGNSNGHRDGTITALNAPAAFASGSDARGPYTAGYWLSGIMLVGLDDVLIDHVSVYDAPAYHVNLFHCSNARVNNSRIVAGDPTVSGNTDAIHINGGCSNISSDNCYFSVGDDCFAVNMDEGDGTTGSNFLLSNATVVNCQTVVRANGNNTRTQRVQVHHLRGSGIRYWVAQVGLGPFSGAPTTAECNASVELSDIEVQVSGPDATYGYSVVYITGNAGVIELNRVKLIESAVAIPMVLMDTASTVSALRMNDCLIHRNAVGNAAAYAFEGTNGTIGDLSVENFRVTEQVGQNYADIPNLFHFNGTALGHATISGRFEGVGNVLNITSASAVGSGVSLNDFDHVSNAGSPSGHSVVGATSSGTIPVSVGRYAGSNLLGLASGAVKLSGPGLQGLPTPDAVMADNWDYLASDHANVPAKRLSGVTKLYTLADLAGATAVTLTGPSSGATNSDSADFTVAPNGVASGTLAVTITPSGGGLSTPIVKTFTTSTPQTFKIHPTANGAVTLTLANNGGLTDSPSTKTYTASAASVATYYEDHFSGTVGASTMGRTPDTTQNGTDVYTGPIQGNGSMVLAPGGGATSSGSNTVWSEGYPLTGASTDQEISVTFVNNAGTGAVPILLLRSDGSPTPNNCITLDIQYYFQGIYFGTLVGGSFTGSVGVYPCTLVAGTSYTLDVTLHGTTITVKLDGVTLTPKAAFTVPVATGSRLAIKQSTGSPGDVIFRSIKVQSA